MATIVAILGCSSATPALGVQDPGNTEDRSSEFWAIVTVGVGLGALGVSCLAILVNLTSKVGDVRERLARVESIVKLRESKGEPDDYEALRWRSQQEFAELLTRDLPLLIEQLARRLDPRRDPPL